MSVAAKNVVEMKAFLASKGGDAEANDHDFNQRRNPLAGDYEETEYQTVAISRLQEILDAIGIKALVTLSA